MVLVACLGQGLAACGQNTSDHIDFALRTLTFEVSNRGSQWRSPPQGPVPNMVCAGPQALSTDCCSLVVSGSPIDCQQYPFACDPSTNYCALTFDVELHTQVDLVAEVPEVAAVDGRAFARVSLSSLTTTIGGLDDLPVRSARLYIGPGSLMSSSDPAATLLGEVNLAAAVSPLMPSAAGQQAFSGLARDYRAPFAFLLSTHLVVGNGTNPGGIVSFDVSARAEAYY